MNLYRDEGVVLRTHKLGEADRIVVLMTAGHGKVRAVAKGVRKTKSRFGGRFEPPSRVSLLLYDGRDLDVVTQADTLDHFPSLREDLDRHDRRPCSPKPSIRSPRRGNPMLPSTGCSRARCGPWRAPAAALSLVAAFYWKLLALEGVAPMLDECVRCASEGRDGGVSQVASELVSFDPVEGGALCRQHRRGAALEPGCLELVRRILGGELAAVLREPASRATVAASGLATTALEAHLERRLRVIHLLGQG